MPDNCHPQPSAHVSAFEHLYVHVPFCHGACTYCALYSERYHPTEAERFLAALHNEIQLRLPLHRPLSVRTIYMGGGTPTDLSPTQLEQLCKSLAVFSASVDEWTCEANPGRLTAAHIQVMAAAGIQRVSLGVQSFTPAVLQTISRETRPECVGRAMHDLRESGIRNIGIDLIAGLPGETDPSWGASLDHAVSLGPEHISVYALTVEAHTTIHEDIKANRMPAVEEDLLLDRLEQAYDILHSAGFVQYETSNYSRPGFACAHNVSCWRGEDYLGLGPGASSRCGLLRRTNLPSVNRYIAALTAETSPPTEEENLPPEDDAAERLVFGFRMVEGVEIDDLLSRLPHPPPGIREKWTDKLSRLAADGLVENTGHRWRLTPRAVHLADTVARELLVDD